MQERVREENKFAHYCYINMNFSIIIFCKVNRISKALFRIRNVFLYDFLEKKLYYCLFVAKENLKESIYTSKRTSMILRDI